MNLLINLHRNSIILADNRFQALHETNFDPVAPSTNNQSLVANICSIVCLISLCHSDELWGGLFVAISAGDAVSV